jgi:demethylmenaquinone methyltransferase / 2-methoxy-6-polyprenyl-1,4-benzoquinol methylase
VTPPQAQPADPSWTAPELADPHANAHKAGKVRGMFAAIARSYDLNNRLHSLWQDQRWRRFAVRAAAVKPGDAVLDCACGTGDLTHAFAASPAARVVGLDFTPQMLDVARLKQHRLPAPIASKVQYLEGDAQALPFPDQSFDVLSIAFGIRNVTDPHAALREFHRVLRPGGRLVILEFDQPRSPLLAWFNGLYCRRIMPRTATLISRDRSGAYHYLPNSVATFLSRDDMCRAIQAAGFQAPAATPLTMGICVCYAAVRA